MEVLNGDHAGSESLGISYLHNIAMYMPTMAEVPNLIRVASNFVKSKNKSAPFHLSNFYNGAKLFIEKLMDVFVEHRVEYASELVGFLNTSVSHTLTTSILALQMFVCCIPLHS